jgi:hypothetical protein
MILERDLRTEVRYQIFGTDVSPNHLGDSNVKFVTYCEIAVRIFITKYEGNLIMQCMIQTYAGVLTMI